MHAESHQIIHLDSRRRVAANDALGAGREVSVCDVNCIAEQVVSAVVPVVTSMGVDLRLSLANALPLVQCAPDAIAFAIGGLIGALMRTQRLSDQCTLSLRTRAVDRAVSITIGGNFALPMSVLRAANHGAVEGEVHATVAHCRKMVVAEGGTFGLRELDGVLGFEIRMPPLSMHGQAAGDAA